MNATTIFTAVVMLLGTSFAGAGEKLTLAESQRLALENNIAIKNSRLETEAARETQRGAFTRFFPSVSAAGLALEAADPLAEITTAGGNLPVYNGQPATLPYATEFAYLPGSTMGLLGSLRVGSLTAVQPIFAGGRIRSGNRLAEVGVEASEDKARLARNEVRRATEQQYWQIVALDEKLKTLESYETLLRRLQEQVEDAYEAGLVMKNDVLKVRLKLSEIRLDKSRAENGRALAAMAFCRHLGIADDPALELADALVAEGQPEPLRVDHRAALEGRPEHRLLQAAVRAETLKTRLTMGEYLPQLSLGVSGFLMRMDDTKTKANGLVFGVLTVPLSGWWGGSHELSRQRAREEIARNALRDGEDLLLLQMEKAWKDLTNADRRLALAREAMSQAEENLKVGRDAYDNGLITVSDLLEAQALRQQSFDRLTDAQAEYRILANFYLEVTAR